MSYPGLGVGTWAWGDGPFWGYGRDHQPGDVVDAFLASVGAGVRLFDTAEVYGHGASEKILGWMARRAEVPLALATKFAPLRGRGGARALVPALRASLRRLGVDSVALYQVHWADRDEATVAALADALAEAVHLGLAARVGVSNFSASELIEAHERLASHGVALATQQVRYSLLHREPERDGVLEACRARGITLLAYSPLAQGALTGRYDAATRPWGPRSDAPEFSAEALTAQAPLRECLREVGRAHGDRPMSQVAINWLRAQPGVVPLVGLKTGAQAAECLGALGWSLGAGDVARLDAACAMIDARRGT
ncbi:MAG: aldo/keto reductase [Polyangiales bacterium]